MQRHNIENHQIGYITASHLYPCPINGNIRRQRENYLSAVCGYKFRND